MHRILFFLFALSAFASLAQDKKLVIHLSPGEPLQGFDSIPFDSITVLDGRFDRANIGVEETSRERVVYVLDGPLPERAELFYQSAIAGLRRNRGRLVLVFRQLQQVGGPLGFFTRVDAYVSQGAGRYGKVATISRRDALSFMGNSEEKKWDKAFRKLMTEVLTSAIDSCRTPGSPGDVPDPDIFHYWEQTYAITQLANRVDGIYHTLPDFRNDRIDTVDCSMSAAPDSSYILFRPQTDTKPVWAVRYHDTLYYRYLEQYWLPLSQDGGRFSFYVPAGLPDIAPQPLAVGTPLTPEEGLDALHAAHLEQGRRKIYSRLLAQMKGHAFYLDLDAGGWRPKDD